MPNLIIQFDTPGYDRLAQELEDVPAKWVDSSVMKDAWRRVHKAKLDEARRMFESQGASGRHGAWPEYTEIEMKVYFWIKTHYLGHGARWKLQWGKLKQRLAPSLIDEGHPEHVWEMSSDGTSAKFGTSVPYAVAHQEGTNVIPAKWGGGKSPRRRMIDPTKRDEQTFRKIIWTTIWGYWNKAYKGAFRSARTHRLRSR